MSMQIMDVASQHLCKNAEIRKWQAGYGMDWINPLDS